MTPTRPLAPILAVLALGTACTDEARFPPKFLFGVATAGFQNEMGCPTIPPSECDDPGSDWHQFITDPIFTSNPSLYLKGDPPSTGPGFYELFDEDFARAKDELKLGSVRLSIEWSRIFPTSTVGVEGDEALKAVASAKGIAFYHRVFAAMRARGLVPMVTLTHYTLPLWLHDAKACHQDLETCPARGWLDERTIAESAKYAGFVAREFGGEVDLWATQNEPLAITLAGYLQPGKDRANPPAVSLRAAEAKTVTMNMILGHARMYDAVKAADTRDADGDGTASEVGLVFNMTPVRPVDPDNNLDFKAAENIFYLYNKLYLNATIKGEFDDDADGTGTLREDLKGRMDYLGINYYTRLTVAGLEGSALPAFSPLLTLDPLSSKNVFWEDYPRGIYEMVTFVKETYGLPIRITETGFNTVDADGKPRADVERLMVETIGWLKRAMDEGADVRGLYWWTLVDNYEWNHGMRPFRMGLYALDVDVPAKPRSLRGLGRTYADIAAAHRIPAALGAKFPIGD
jgi:beta-glucosidase/6-phospho-beta-glucosidase/beta-galactosidase